MPRQKACPAGVALATSKALVSQGSTCVAARRDSAPAGGFALLAARRASSAEGFCTCVAARRVSARHPSNFHLRAQMKVTKAKGPEHQPFDLLASATRLLQRLWLENTLRATASVSSLRFKHSLSLRLDPSGHRFGFLCQSFCRSPVAGARRPNGWCSRASFWLLFLAPQKK